MTHVTFGKGGYPVEQDLIRLVKLRRRFSQMILPLKCWSLTSLRYISVLSLAFQVAQPASSHSESGYDLLWRAIASTSIIRTQWKTILRRREDAGGGWANLFSFATTYVVFPLSGLPGLRMVANYLPSTRRYSRMGGKLQAYRGRRRRNSQYVDRKYPPLPVRCYYLNRSTCVVDGWQVRISHAFQPLP